ncbi:MAG: outer membrane beta-barrel protein [Sphingopyxis sp.]|nr:outer membrane beta-barrel protein [Sphingopyxis sp.]
MRNLSVDFRSVAGLSGLILLAGPQAALAQKKMEPITELRFDLGATAESNIARSSALLAQQRGLERDDFVVTPTVNLNLARQLGRAEVMVNGQLGYSFHAKNTELNRERIGVNVSAELPLSICRISPTFGIQRRQSDLRDVVFVPNVGVENAKNAETTQRYGITVGCGRSPGLQPFVGVDYERADNSNPLRERAEYDATTLRGGLRYASPALGEVSIYGSQRSVDLSPVGAPVGTDNSYRFEQISADFRRDIGTRITTKASLGYGKISSNNALVSGFSGVVWNVDVSALIGASMRLAVGTGREVGNSQSSDASFVVTKPHRVRLEYAFSDRAHFDGGLLYTQKRFGYRGAQPVLAITNEERQLYDAGLALDVGRNLTVRVYGGHERRNANGTFFDYRASFAGASLSLRI